MIGIIYAMALQTEYPIRNILGWPIAAVLLCVGICYMLYLMFRDITLWLIRKTLWLIRKIKPL
jgi:hypothetical protein